MIDSIELRNFKGHRETRVPLGRLTVLVGPNGAGKTSVLQALSLLSSMTSQNDLKRVLVGEMSPQDLAHRPSHGPISLSTWGVLGEFPWGLTLTIPLTEKLHSLFSAEELKLSWHAKGREEEHDGDRVFSVQSLKGAERERAYESMGSAVLYRFDSRRIAAAAYSAEENPAIAEDGANTAVVLASLKLENEEAFEQVETELRKIIPNIQRIRVRRAKLPPSPKRLAQARKADLNKETRIGHKIYLDFDGAADIPAHAASEGTLITLALLTALCSPNRPRLLLLDDIGHSLHPQAQMQLMRELKQLLERFPEVQVIATTHSPYILDELEPSDVQVFALRKDGSVACRSLSAHPQAEQTRGVLTAGQLWSLDPEYRWVVGEG